MDEEFGAGIARSAKASGYTLAMPVERTGRQEFEFEFGDDFGSHVEAFDPTFAKVLVRFNPDGDAQLNSRQAARLARLTHWLRDHQRDLLLELLVPATEAQLAQVDGDRAAAGERIAREYRGVIDVYAAAAALDATPAAA